MIALDTETTGLDAFHGARPFFVTTCDDKGIQRWWEAPVDPLTRKVHWDAKDIEEIRELVKSVGLIETDDENRTPGEFLLDTDFTSAGLVLQNAKFDVAALASVDPWFSDNWPWDRTDDTLLASHVLASNMRHDLTALATQYLRIDIQPYEDRLEEAVQQARRYCRSHLPDWRIAAEGLPDMPSVKEKTWKNDLWLPKTLVQKQWDDSDSCKRSSDDLDGWEYRPPDPRWVGHHPWWTVLEEYANTDSAVTVSLWAAMVQRLQERKLWKIYLAKRKVGRIAHLMERHGITACKPRMDVQKKEYQQESLLCKSICHKIANKYNYDLNLPKSGNNKSLLEFCFGPLGLPAINRTDKGNPSLDKATMEQYLTTLPQGDGLAFVQALTDKRLRDTALAYMDGYERFWLPWVPVGDVDPQAGAGWFVLHPNLNPTGTDTLRWSSNNPNEQNISKKEGFNLRQGFGPALGREWWSLDAQNIELRIPAFKSGEKALVDVFMRPKDPPYYGSYHLVVFDALHPQMFAQYGKRVKDADLYESTWYQWVKNGNFALIYGAQKETADRSYRVDGAFDTIRSRFPGIAKLNDKVMAFANKHGYIETVPDLSVDPERGYPLLCSRSSYGKILPTVPLNYYVSGTACWWMQQAMVRCQERLDEWNAAGFDGHIAMQVHDELVFDFPKGKVHPREEKYRPIDRRSNLWRIRILQKLMERGGEDIGVPTPVAVEYNETSWAEGEGL